MGHYSDIYNDEMDRIEERERREEKKRVAKILEVLGSKTLEEKVDYLLYFQLNSFGDNIFYELEKADERLRTRAAK